MLQINNQEMFGKAVAQALAGAAQNPQGRKIENWTKQIARAAVEIESNPFMHYDSDRQTMVILSTEVYEANGVCQCKAAQKGIDLLAPHCKAHLAALSRIRSCFG